MASDVSRDENGPIEAPLDPSAMDEATFVATFGGVFEHSPWVARGAFARGLPDDADTAAGLHRAMCAVLREASAERRLDVINAHPDLAGKLASAGRLTPESGREQASAGLDRLTDAERTRFNGLNDAYKQKFEVPFIIAVKGLDKDAITAEFERRLRHDRADELAEALRQVERIARLRLETLLPPEKG